MSGDFPSSSQHAFRDRCLGVVFTFTFNNTLLGENTSHEALRGEVTVAF